LNGVQKHKLWSADDPIHSICDHMVTWNADYSISWKKLVCGMMVYTMAQNRHTVSIAALLRTQ